MFVDREILEAIGEGFVLDILYLPKMPKKGGVDPKESWLISLFIFHSLL
jgi:hypothetical protein